MCELTPETLARTSFGPSVADGTPREPGAAAAPRTAGSTATSCRATSTAWGACSPCAASELSAELEVEPPPALPRFLVTKGSVTVDGVSLTVAGLAGRRFHGRAHPVYTGPDDAGRGPARRPGQPRSGRDRQVRPASHGSTRTGVKPKDTSPFSSIPEALADFRDGRMVVVVDDEDRENEGDLTIAAQHVTPDVINFMATHGRGLICLPMTGRAPGRAAHPAHGPGRGEQRALRHRVLRARSRPSRAPPPASRPRTARARSWRPIDAAHASRPTWRGPATCSRCGRRTAACWCARARPRRRSTSRAWPACTRRASSARSWTTTGRWRAVPRLERFCRQHGLRMITIKDLIQHRMRTERLVRKVAEASLPDRATAPSASTSSRASSTSSTTSRW